MVKKKTKYKYFVKNKFLFLRKLFLRRNKHLTRKDLYFNYFFYKSMLNFYKLKKQKYIFNVFF